jgi:hypothetical protein
MPPVCTRCSHRRAVSCTLITHGSGWAMRNRRPHGIASRSASNRTRTEDLRRACARLFHTRCDKTRLYSSLIVHSCRTIKVPRTACYCRWLTRSCVAEMGTHQQLHGDGVKDIAFQVEDLDAIVAVRSRSICYAILCRRRKRAAHK